MPSTSREPAVYQDLSRFRVPAGFRGRGPIAVQLWWLVQATLFRLSPQICYGWRRFLLRLFGAHVGPGVLVRASAEIIYPWKVWIGAHSWIGDGAKLYSLGEIRIGPNSVVSQYAHLCAGSHDASSVTFDLQALPITVGAECWVASEVFVAPGVTIGDGTVVGARSTVFHDLPPGMICYGNPARPVRRRK
jgi:putative colanic acid biosynthesis acetyltransferase WcaF